MECFLKNGLVSLLRGFSTGIQHTLKNQCKFILLGVGERDTFMKKNTFSFFQGLFFEHTFFVFMLFVKNIK